MPVRTRLIKSGASKGKYVVVDDAGRVKTKPMSKKKAVSRVQAENLAVRRSQGKKAPPRRKGS
ncbi:MAG: hypothetical protein ACR2PS_02115 [Pseudomonadales bacterium]